MGVTTPELLIAVVVSFAAAVVQGSIGMGFNIVSVPILALVNPLLAPVPQLVISFPISVAAVARERSAVDLSAVGWILAGRVPGAALGIGLLAIASARMLDVLIAAFVLFAVAVLGRGWRLRRTRLIDFSAGVAAGTTGLVASMGGPPLALLFSGERGPTLRSTLGLLLAAGLLISLVGRTIAGEILMDEVVIGAVLIAPALAGFAASNRLLARVEGRVLRTGVLALSTTAAVVLLGRAIAG